MTPYISTVVMTYNEAKSLESTVTEIDGVLKALGRTYEIIIVDDGSSDGSGVIADRIAGSNPGVRVIHHDGNKGLGDVYRTGYKESTGELVTFFPADGQFPADIINKFVSRIDDADMLLGYLPKCKRPLIARALSLSEKALYALLFGPMPKFQGIMMFRRNLLEKINLKSEGRNWVIVMELIIRAKRNGYRIKNIPTELRPRKDGLSKVNNLSSILENLRTAIALRLNF